jgi:hypothetical protein
LPYLERNLNYLTGAGTVTRHEADTIRSATLPKEYRIEPSAAEPDNPTLIAGSAGESLAFHDKNAPVAEAGRTASRIAGDETALLMFGAGLGYEIEAAVRTCPQLTHVAIIEYEPALLKAAFGRFDMSEYPGIRWFVWTGDLSNTNIVSIDEFEKATCNQKLATIANPAFLEFHAMFFERFQHTFRMTEYDGDVTRLLQKIIHDNRFEFTPAYLLQKLYDLPFPNLIRIEPTNFCNLKCTICPTPGYPNDKKGFMDISLFRRILDEIETIAPGREFYLVMYLGGESLMHRDICEMIRMASDRGHLTQLNTNCTLLTSELSEQLIKAGLSRIQFSFDDFTPEQFENIRVGSDREKIFSNILEFIAIRERLGSKTPDQVIAALKIPTENDLDDFPENPFLSMKFLNLLLKLPINIIINWAHHWASDFTAVAEGMAPATPLGDYFPCQMLWNEMSVRWDGTVVPCCFDLRSDHTLGRFPDEGLLDIWNGAAFTALRQMHIAGRAGHIPLCRGCSTLGSQTRLADFLGDSAHIYKKHIINK